MMTDQADGVWDIAIVGGGVSGAYCGWRLMSAGPSPAHRIALFEGSERIGGRLLSVQPPGIAGTKVELGGMRYITSHHRVASLLHELGIASVPFAVDEPENIRFLRGRCLRSQDMTNPDLLPYDLLPDERTPQALEGGFTRLAAQRMVRSVLGKDIDLGSVDWDVLARTGTYDGRRLQDLPLRYVMQRTISPEALSFAADTSGYDAILRTWNAADGFPWNVGDYGRSITYMHPQPGYDSLPGMLAERFRARGGIVAMERKLVSLDQVEVEGTAAISLSFADGHTELASKVILAMPRRSLELLQRSGPVLGPDNRAVHELIASVTPIPLFKLAICYPFAWWQTIDPVQVEVDGTKQWRRLTRGESITDLPLRQCYYWAVDPGSGNAVVLIYDDGSDLDFWAGLRDRSKGAAFGSMLESNSDASTEWRSHRAPTLMVEEAHRQLVAMHGVSQRPDIPRPYAAAYRDWGEDPFGGGSNYWHVHVDSQAVSRAILQPKPPIPVYISGEAYSHNQGWVEGALETSDQLLELHFGMPRPPWLNDAPGA